MKASRQRYYKMFFNSSFTVFTNKLREYAYNDDTSIGFDLIDISKNHLNSRYIEKQNITEEIIHPYGDVEKTTFVRYIIFNFQIILAAKGVALIRIINPPSSLKSFVSKLSETYQNGFFISKIQFEVENIYLGIISNSNIDRFLVTKLEASSIPFGKKTTASIKLNSTDNAYDELISKYKKQQYILDKMAMNARINGEEESIEITSSGLVTCTNGFESIIEKHILETIK